MRMRKNVTINSKREILVVRGCAREIVSDNKYSKSILRKSMTEKIYKKWNHMNRRLELRGTRVALIEL